MLSLCCSLVMLFCSEVAMTCRGVPCTAAGGPWTIVAGTVRGHLVARVHLLLLRWVEEVGNVAALRNLRAFVACLDPCCLDIVTRRWTFQVEEQQ